MLERAAEIEVIGAARRYRDAHAFAVDLGDAADRGLGGHEKGDRDLEIGLGERNLGCALRLGAEKADVALAVAHGVGELAGLRELHELDRDAEPPAELAAKVGRDAARRAVGRVLEDEEEVAVVQADAQLAARSELFLASFICAAPRAARSRIRRCPGARGTSPISRRRLLQGAGAVRAV